MLDSRRACFDLPDDVTYLNCANMAPQLRAVADAGRNAVARRSRPWGIASADWFSGGERLRELFARLIQADPDGVALVPAASYGIAIAAANLPVSRGQTIVLLDREFPSNVYAWLHLAERQGASVHFVRASDGRWTDAVLDSIDASTAVVSVPNCHWIDGTLVDLSRIGAAARAVGAALVVDGSQSVGAYPLDVGTVRPDFLVTVGYKWLMGPYGLGYLYVGPRWRAGEPLERSWLSRAGAEDFTRLATYTTAYREGARRFDVGEFPHFVLTPMAIAALEQILLWGVGHIQDTLADLTAQAAADVIALGGEAPPPDRRVGHMAGLRLPGGVPRPVLEALAASRVYVSVRDQSIRVAPHLHNDAADIARFSDALKRGLSRS